MSAITTQPTDAAGAAEAIPPLRDGDRLTRAEFERRYDAMPGLKKAELIRGVVYMPPPPVFDDHAAPHFNVIFWLGLYGAHTPGVVGSDNGSIRMEPESMPQPDAFLRILETHGGKLKRTPDRYIEGGPELAAEVAVTSAKYDLNIKLPLYRDNGVQEYLVWRVVDRAVDWFVLRGDTYERLPLSADGIYRSEILPGLWLDAGALFRGDLPAVMQALQQGVNSPEHAAFVQKLQQAAAPQQP
jgi:Uma2 family endonuclease